MNPQAALTLFYLLLPPEGLEEGGALYGISWEQQQTRELLFFVRSALEELGRRGLPPKDCLPRCFCPRVRITRTLRIYVGEAELEARPMVKCVLLLFLNHPEGIPLKRMADYRAELTSYYRRLCRREDPAAVEQSVDRLLNLCSNYLNVNISRVNEAVRRLVQAPALYQIGGPAGGEKGIPLDRSLVVWE